MMKLRVLIFAIVILATGATLVSFNGCGGSSGGGGTPPPPGAIKHVVIIFQENRSTDNLFQDQNLINKGADILQSGTDSHGTSIPLHKVSLQVDYNPDHSHDAFNSMCDFNAATGQCKMDGADLVTVYCNPGAKDCPAPDLTFGYVDPTEVQPYFQMAEQYTFADHMFQTNQGPSFPAHQFIISGTSAPSATSNLFASENTSQTGHPDSGCDSQPSTIVALIDPAGNEGTNSPIYPCWDYQTITDLLEGKGYTWRYYTPPGPSIWNGPRAIQHICGPNNPPPNGTACVGPKWQNVILNQKQVLTDIGNNQLQNVTWVIPDGADSDHAGTSGTTGPSWVASIVNAIGNSAYWKDTAIFITWDDWGGWYDHVPPRQVLVNCAQWGCGYVYGFRVPLIVVSPYAKAGYISKGNHDFGSILHYIETTFGLASLGRADAAADDLSDCFDYNQTPIPFVSIAAPLKAQDFLNRTTPPKDPDDD